jgi:hypothetical protein
MTLATKDGSLIVKDGNLAENCGCCGGWYCCFSPACFADSINTVSATVAVQDYLVQRYTGAYILPGVFSYQHASVGIVGSMYNGTFSLPRIGMTNVWRYDFPSQRSCTGYIQLSANQYGWTTTFAWSVVSYVMYTQSQQPMSASSILAAGTYKELADMSCIQGGIFPNPVDAAAGWGTISGPTKTLTWSGGVDACSSLTGATWPVTFQAVYPPLPNSDAAAANPYPYNQKKEQGVNGITLSLTVS